MTLLTKCICLIIAVFLSACSSTANKDYQLIEREYAKKPLVSDHQLKIALLNRPIPQDQLMMMAFTQARTLEGENGNMVAHVGFVEIKGLRSADKTDVPTSRRVTSYTAQDSNAISILGPSRL